jgi:carbon storage regulator
VSVSFANEGDSTYQEGFPMRVLSRRTDESVWIGASIQVKVLDIQGSRVKLGFIAPREMQVQREEIRDACPVRPEHFEVWRQCDAGELCPT